MKKIAVLGYGGRGRIYAQLCRKRKKDFEIVAVIDTAPAKLEMAAQEQGIDKKHLFGSLEDFLNAPKEADWLFVCTQDKDHKAHAVRALDAGYHLLLEKPIATTAEDCLAIAQAAKRNNRQVQVCHVLRYSLYYDKIKAIMDSGQLGKIISIEQVENVGYWHQAHSFVRGDWRDTQASTPMILSKCCHDLDIAVYLAGAACASVESIGKLNFFKKENAPAGAAPYCLDGCRAKAQCPYDCEKLYIDPIKALPPFTYQHKWPQNRVVPDGVVTIPKLYAALRTGQFGRCVFQCDNNAVDYQSVNMEFKNGITATLIMTAFSGRMYRETRIRGTLGELICDMGKSQIWLHRYGRLPHLVNIGAIMDGHGGGDKKLIEHLAKDTARADIAMSIESHLIGFAAEQSRLNGGKPVCMDTMRAAL